MKICLKTQALADKPAFITLDITERLPASIASPCQLSCIYQVQAHEDYYLLNLATSGRLEVICQRCMQQFSTDYAQKTELAICNTEEIAEKLMEQFECIVIPNRQVDLLDIITDELHLFAPEKHENINLCDGEIKQFLSI